LIVVFIPCTEKTIGEKTYGNLRLLPNCENFADSIILPRKLKISMQLKTKIMKTIILTLTITLTTVFLSAQSTNFGKARLKKY
jgi:hypothetical protein